MNVTIKLDTSQFKDALKKITLDRQDLLDIEGAGAYVAVNGMRMRVPVQTAATKNSIKPHIVEADNTHVIDEVGPETDYAPYLEYGTGVYAEGGNGRQTPWVYFSEKLGHFVRTVGMKAQPFIRPTAIEDDGKIQNAVSSAFKKIVEGRWPK